MPPLHRLIMWEKNSSLDVKVQKDYRKKKKFTVAFAHPENLSLSSNCGWKGKKQKMCTKKIKMELISLFTLTKLNHFFKTKGKDSSHLFRKGCHWVSNGPKFLC